MNGFKNDFYLHSFEGLSLKKYAILSFKNPIILPRSPHNTDVADKCPLNYSMQHFELPIMAQV